MTQEESLMYTLVKCLQKERNLYKSKFKSVERKLTNKNIQFYIIEEKEQIWRREREFYIKQQALLRSELEACQDLTIRLEAHVNSLNILLLPNECIVLNFNEYASDKNSDSDSSYDDMIKDYGAVAQPKDKK